MGQGIYVHIPFCLSKCPYCAFNSRPVSGGVPEFYLRALLEDAAGEAGRWKDRGEFDSVFFGGGTPSLLSGDRLERLMGALHESLRISPRAEVTVECNPNTLDRERLAAFKRAGVNRLSVGIQSLSDPELRMLGRTHSLGEAVEALRAAREVSGMTVSADLIAGIPGQTGHSLAGSLETVGAYADHVSVYLLSVEPGTGLERQVLDGEVKMPADEEVIGLYSVACDELASAGFHRYEISNWSKAGSECVHNTTYWSRGDYLGLGAGAHSHIAGLRYAKSDSPWEYARGLATGGDGVVMRERLDAFQMYMEHLMLGLRLDRGIDPVGTAADYGVDPGGVLDCLETLLECGFVSRTGNRILVSAKGIMLQDAITEQLVSAACPVRGSVSA